MQAVKRKRHTVRRRCEIPRMPPAGKLLLEDAEVAGLLGVKVRDVRILRHNGKLRNLSPHSHPRTPRIDVERLAGCA